MDERVSEPIVLATGNPHKVEELRTIMGPLGIAIVGLKDLPGWEKFVEPEETGGTFEENATIKALGYAAQTGRVCLADDSGLEIDALGGRPGVISSHYCTDGRETGMSRGERDAANNARVMREMKGVPEGKRGARFVCVMVVADGREAKETGGSGVPPVRTFGGAIEKRRSGVLPHWQIGGATHFVTYTLAEGSLDDAERQMVFDSLKFFDGARYWLHSAVVMPDHVHFLFRPIQQADGDWPTLASIMHSLKNFTSKEINKKRGSRGRVWQDEYFDTIMRNDAASEERCRYMEMNPVEAGLCKKPGEYPFLYRQVREPVVRTEDGRDARPPGISILAVSRGEFEGVIGVPPVVPRGENGFGYDPLLLVGPDYQRTSAELQAEEKNRLSHRGMAARGMVVKLRELGLVGS